MESSAYGTRVRVVGAKLDIADVMFLRAVRQSNDDEPMTPAWPRDICPEHADYRYEPLLAIERKASDLVSSIMSGHLHQQKGRMRQLRAETNCRLALMVEGTHKYLPSRGLVPVSYRAERRFGYKGVRTLLLKSQLLDEFSVFLTADLAASAEHCVEVARHILEQTIGRASDWALSANRPGDVGVRVRARDNATPQNYYVHSVLGGITGVSPALAKTIARRYPTKRALEDAYDACPSVKGRQTMLVAIEREDAAPTKSGKRRQLGPALSKRIYEFAGRTPPE